MVKINFTHLFLLFNGTTRKNLVTHKDSTIFLLESTVFKSCKHAFINKGISYIN